MSFEPTERRATNDTLATHMDTKTTSARPPSEAQSQSDTLANKQPSIPPNLTENGTSEIANENGSAGIENTPPLSTTETPTENPAMPVEAVETADESSEPRTIAPLPANEETGEETSLHPDAESWKEGGEHRWQEIDGRYVLGEPAGTFTQMPHMPQQSSARYHRCDINCDFNVIGSLQVMAASLRGALHYSSLINDVRQDSFALGTDDDHRWLIAVVADGVSNSVFSHELASFASRQTVVLIKKALKELGDNDIFSLNWQGIGDGIAAMSLECCKKMTNTDYPAERYLNTFATTIELVVIATTPTAEADYPFVSVTVAGDGAAYMLDPQKGWLVVKPAKKQSGPLATNAVDALPHDYPSSCIVQTGKLSQNERFFLTTDGLGDFLEDGTTSLGGFLQEKLPLCRSAVEFIRVMDVCVPHADDDRTGVLIGRRSDLT